METNKMIINIPLNVAVALLIIMTAPVPLPDYARLYLGTLSLYCLPDDIFIYI